MVYYPLKVNTFFKSKKVHYVHIAIAVVGLLAPTICPLLTTIAKWSGLIAKDYKVFLYPPNICINAQVDIRFYGLVMPLNFIIATGITFLLLILWKLYKV